MVQAFFPPKTFCFGEMTSRVFNILLEGSFQRSCYEPGRTMVEDKGCHWGGAFKINWITVVHVTCEVAIDVHNTVSLWKAVAAPASKKRKEVCVERNKQYISLTTIQIWEKTSHHPSGKREICYKHLIYHLHNSTQRSAHSSSPCKLLNYIFTFVTGRPRDGKTTNWYGRRKSFFSYIWDTFMFSRGPNSLKGGCILPLIFFIKRR